MLYAIIIGCEIGFWAFLLAGLIARYIFKQQRLSTILLICAPLVDLVLLVTSVIDLRGGAEPSAAHALAAVYIGVSVAWGPQIIEWADKHFAHRFAGQDAPEKPPKTGTLHARRQRQQWLRHLSAWAIGTSLIGTAAALAHNTGQGLFRSVVLYWTIILAIDFVISFSYTFSPRKPK